MSYYVTNDNSFLDIKNAHLRVTGNVHTDVMKLGAVEFAPSQSTVAGTVNFTNVTTGVTTSSNLSVGGTLSLGTVEVVATTHTLANTTAVGNVTPHTIQFSNVTTGIVTTANVEVGGELTVTGNVVVGDDLTVTGNVAVDTDTLFVDSVNNRVGIGTTSPDYKLEVNGTLGQNGKEIYAQRRWEIDLTAQSNAIFYPIEFKHPQLEGTPDLPDMYPVHFKVFGESLGGSDPYNENTLVGYARGSGWTDHNPMYDVHVVKYSSSELRFQGLYEGNSSYLGGVVIYMRGGYRYSTLTDASEVVTHITTFSHVSDNTTVFALKNVSGADVSGTSARITQLVNISGNGSGEQRWMSGSLNIPGNVGIGTTNPSAKLELNQGTRPSASSATHGMRWSNTDNANHWHLFNSNNDHFRFVFNGVAKGYVDPNDANAQMNFTGQHRTFIKDIPFTRAIELEGLIVSADNNKYIKMSGGIEAGSNAITTNESLPIVSLSATANDKKCFGVISASEDPENRTEQYGAFGTNFDKEKGDTRVYVNSVGEGAIWVTNINGSLESGDYITTSNVAGYGQKQDSEFLANYTVAKITMDCDFSPVTQPIQNIKKDETGENTLDEHGQIQWEDHPTETEKAYKIRYLDASGVETDEASAVHKAAFVGCTYHCG